MADVATALKGEDGIAFLVAAGLMLEGVAAYCSSPQTTELNAKARAGTLMKWVYLGIAQSYLLLLAAAYVDKRHRRPACPHRRPHPRPQNDHHY